MKNDIATRREDILDDLQSIAENGERSVGETALMRRELAEIDAKLRARMIRQAGLEAVAKALSAASPCERT